jgi:hypothetical protein
MKIKKGTKERRTRKGNNEIQMGSASSVCIFLQTQRFIRKAGYVSLHRHCSIADCA